MTSKEHSNPHVHAGSKTMTHELSISPSSFRVMPEITTINEPSAFTLIKTLI